MFDWFWEFLYRLLKTLLYCIDFIMIFAGKLVGIEPVYDANNKEVELLNSFFRSQPVLDAFKAVALVGVMLLFLFTAFAVVRAIGRMGEGKSPISVCLSGAKSILYFLLMPAIMIIGSMFVSAVMTAIYRATSGNAAGLGSSMFTLFAEEAYNGGGNQAEVMDLFRQSGPFVEDPGDFNYYSMGDVKNYFSLSKMNYFIGFVSGFAVLFMLIRPLMSFVERIVSLILLFIISPISVASSVLDDGVRFKLWRDQVINKFLVAYGSLLALNIFVILVDVVYDVTFFPNSSFLNGLARLVFVLGGASACRMGTVLIGNLVNSGAGSQYAQDMQNTTSPFQRIAQMGMALQAQKSLGGLFRAGKGGGGGGQQNVHKSATAGKSGGGSGTWKSATPGGGGQRFTDRVAKGAAGTKVGNKAAGSAAQGASSKSMQGVLLGGHRTNGGAQSGASGAKGAPDNAMNKAGAATVKDAMKMAKESGISGKKL